MENEGGLERGWGLGRGWGRVGEGAGEGLAIYTTKTPLKSNVGFRKRGSCNSRFVLKPDFAMASEVSVSSKNSLAITDFLAKRASQLLRKLPGPPLFPCVISKVSAFS